MYKKEINKSKRNDLFEPEDFLISSKYDCFLKLFTIKLRELFKERYYLESKRTYKDNPMHGEFIIEMLGDKTFNSFDTETQATIKTGIVNKWPTELLYVLLLSYPYKCIDSDKLKKENQIIETFKAIEESFNMQYEIDELMENFNESINQLSELYISIGGKESQINLVLHKIKTGGSVDYVGDGNGDGGINISNSNSNDECIIIKDKADQLLIQGKYDDAIDQYDIAIHICNNFENDFSLLSKLVLNKSLAKFKSVTKHKDTESIDILLYDSIKELVYDCKWSIELTPSNSESWVKLAFYKSRKGSLGNLVLANKYIDVALLLDPNNYEILKLKQQFSNDLESRSNYIKLFKQINEKGEDYIFHTIAELYINSNKLDIQSLLQKHNETTTTTTTSSTKSINSKKKLHSKSLSNQYYNQGMDNKLNGQLKSAFRSFCNSILSSGGNNDYYAQLSYYQLGLMYAYGNTFIEMDHRIAITLFYKCLIGDGGNDKYLEKPTVKNQKGKLRVMRELAKIYYEGIQVVRCTEISLYWLRRIYSVEEDYNGLEFTEVSEDEIPTVGHSLYSLGTILFCYDIRDYKMGGGWKRINNDLQDTTSEIFKVLSKGYYQYNDPSCFNLLERNNPNEATKLMSKNQFEVNIGCKPTCTHVIGLSLFKNELLNHFKKIHLDYDKIKKFATHPTQPSIQAQRIIQCLDLVAQFLKQFKTSYTFKEKDKSIQFLADAFIYKELYAIKIPDDVMLKLNDYLIKSLSLTKNPSKSLSIVWIGCNCFNIIKRDCKEFIKRNEKMIEFIKKSINRFPKDVIFKFFSSIFNRYNGNFEAALNDLNKCINSTTITTITDSTKSTSNNKTNTTTTTTTTTSNYCSSDIYYYYKADTLFNLNRYQESIESLNQYLIKSPSDAKWRMDSYYLIAEMSSDIDKYDLNLKIAKESESKSLYCFLPYSKSK